MNFDNLFSIAKHLWVIFGPSPYGIVTDLWMLLGLYWIVSALRQKRVSKREAWLGRLGHAAAFALGASLIFGHYAHFGRLGTRFVRESFWIAVAGIVVTAAGVALAMWARLHLGDNWSGTVSIREQHELIRSGPYRWMRHPIYSGILLGMAGTILVVGEVRALIGFAAIAAALYAKARKEEGLLTREFGSSFETHRTHTGMFLPRLS
jgi:protein-S-isoprenylcysteine O-methyltransferase Ste14